ARRRHLPPFLQLEGERGHVADVLFVIDDEQLHGGMSAPRTKKYRRYSPSFGSTLAAAVSASEAAAYAGSAPAERGTCLATMSFVPKTPSFSIRNSNLASSSWMIGPFASSPMSHMRCLNGPRAFLRVL